ncbi:MAG: TetR/AcrR family transcriptional regulator [Acidobacteria bacterium]|nr:TetR/AcrR family transcriptional regulator [Acidobacteriota bacterium]
MANKVSTRETILKTALECFNELGFQATTIEEIRIRSQASIGSIYHHFTNKEQLAASLYLEGLRSYQEGFLEVLEKHNEAENGIKALVIYHLEWVTSNANLAKYIFHSRQSEFIGAEKSNLKAMNKDAFQAFTKWLRPHIKKDKVKDLPADVCLSILIGPSQEFARHWLSNRVKTNITEASALLADAAWNSLTRT